MEPIGYRHPMTATNKTYSTTGIKQGPNYLPQGKSSVHSLIIPNEVQGVNFAPFMKGQEIGNWIENFTDVGSKVNRNKKKVYYGGYNPVKRAPGVYPLGKPGPEGYGNQVERANWTNSEPNQYEYPADLINAIGLNDRQVGEAHMPHQWKRDPIEMDMSQRHISEFFHDVSSKMFERKIDDLRAKGYGDYEIEQVIVDMRKRDIEKGLKGGSHDHLRYEDIRDEYMVPESSFQPIHRPVAQHASKIKTRYHTNNGF